MAKKNKKPITSVRCTDRAVEFHVVDVDAGEIFTLIMTYSELEEFVRENGEKQSLGSLPRAISNGIRNSMES